MAGVLPLSDTAAPTPHGVSWLVIPHSPGLPLISVAVASASFSGSFPSSPSLLPFHVDVPWSSGGFTDSHSLGDFVC